MLVEGGAIGFMLVTRFSRGNRRACPSGDSRSSSGPERGLVGGAVFGLIALSVQSCADFAPHVPAVGVLAVVLCGLIARHGRAPAWAGKNTRSICRA